MNERLLAVRSSSFLASFAFQASHTDFSTATKASVFGSSAFSAGSAAGAGRASGEFFGSMIGFSPWKAACHLSPLRTQTVAARVGLGIFIDLPSGPVHVPSQVLR